MGDKKLVLPPGFQFDPTDEELIVHFLCGRAASLPCCPDIIPDLDIYAADPWELNEKAFWSKRKWYFFSRLKQNRSTRKGFWKEVGFSKPIFTSNGDEVGIKYYLVFNGDEVKIGSKLQTNWIMEEYHLPKNGENDQIQDTNEWVLCRVHEATFVDSQESECSEKSNTDDGVELSYLDEVFFSIEDEQEEITFPT